METFYKFPRTPHLFWMGRGGPRDDKVLSPDEADTFLDSTIIIEEKVDGANVGFSFAKSGDLRIQNRGQYLPVESHGQFGGIRQWVQGIEDGLLDGLGDMLILFGEWCYSQHSVHYSRLPNWLLVFDVFDKNAKAFWCVEERNLLLDKIGLPRVAEIARGRFSRESLLELLDSHSAYGARHVEGLYLRRESAGFLEGRAKVVRAEFAEGITDHWSRKPMMVNERRGIYG